MAIFPSKQYNPDTILNKWAAAYRRQMNRRPFLFFGLPFLATVLAGSFLLTPFTAMRYEANDRKSRAMSQEEFKGFERKQRPFDIQEEYWRLQSRVSALDLGMANGFFADWVPLLGY